MDEYGLMKKAKEIKYKCASLCIHSGKGHLSSALSCAEIMTVLYYDVMRINPKKPKWEKRDRFVMSKNHGSVITYPILCDLGFYDEEFLNTYQKDGSVLGTHSKLGAPGVDFAGGSLGIGLGAACGIACAGVADESDYLVFCLVGDCEMQEGAIWEADMFAGHRRLNNLVMIVDQNNEGCTDFISELIPLKPLGPKLTSFGWEVKEVADGHSIKDLREGFRNIRYRGSDRPLAVLVDTVKGNGVSSLEGVPWMHGQTPTGEEGRRALKELRRLL